MRKILSIARYEYKMQLGRFAAWGVLLAALLFSLMDNYPSAANLARLEFLPQPAYFIARVIGFDVLLVAFGLLFYLSNRIPVDEKTGVKALMMASPVQKGQYVAGKLAAAVAYTFTMLCLYLAINMSVYCVAAPFAVPAAECVALLCKAALVSILPISVFVGFSAVALPALVDIRLFYLLAGILFLLNASHVNSAGASPFYLIASGDLARLLWVHPRYPQIDYAGVRANLLFLLGGGFGSLGLLLLRRKFWRAE